MADSQDKQVNIEVKKKSNNRTEAKNKNNNIIFVYLFILTIFIIALGITQIKLSTDSVETQNKNNLEKKLISEQKDNIELFLKNLANTTEANFSNIFNNQQKQIDNLTAQLENNNQNKELPELESIQIVYLIKSANMQVQIYNNPTQAILLLQHAQKLLETQNNNQDLLSSVINDINKLKDIHVIDKNQILELIPDVLLNLSNNVKTNSQNQASNNTTKETKNTPDNSNKNIKNKEKSNLSFKDKLIDKIENIVIIRRHDIPTKPIFDEYESNIIILNLNIYFEALSLCVLEDNSEIYHLYLNKITKLIKTYNLDNEQVSTQLEKLKNAGFKKYNDINLQSFRLIKNN